MIEIKSLKELRHNDNGRFGNKAVRLGELIGQGVNVPKGFCISIDLHEYVERNGSDSIPEPTLKELEDIYLSFGGKAVAVRSSSIVEDLAQSSFAGLYDSFLNIASFDSMVQKIIQCIKSAGQEHVNEYSKNFDIDRRRIKMAVIIQEMVAAEYSGVLFTANPINNRYDQYVINGAEGLGEKVVDGSVIPEQWVISKETETVINVTDKMESGVLMESGILDEAMLKSLIQNAKEIEEHFNYPQDIEWSMIEGQVYILQSRDITTLYPVDSDVRNLEKQHLYLCYNTIIQGMNEPFTPLGAEFWRLTFAGYTSIYFNGKKKILYPNWIKNINGRIHYDVTEVVGKKSYIKKLPGSLNAKDPSGGKLMGEILEQHRSTFLNQGGKFKLSFGIVKWGLSLLKYGKLGKTNPEKAVEEVKQMGDEYIERLKLRVKNADTLRKKLKLIEEVTEEYLTLAFQQVMYCSYGLKSAEKHDKWIEKQYGQKFDLDIIKKALPNNPTTEMGLAMSRIAVELNEKQQELTVEHPLIQEFIKTYGHRGDLEIDMGMKRWREDMSYPMSIIKSYMKDGLGQSNLDNFAENNSKALEAIEAMCNQIAKEHGNRKAEKFKSDYLNYRTTLGLRERPKFDMLRGLDILRDMMVSAGTDMKSKGLIEEAADIAYLTFEELENSDKYDLKIKVEEAKSVYGQQNSFETVPRFIMSSGECFYSPSATVDQSEGEECLQGVPISRGVFRGTVRILHSPVDTKINKDEVLVTHNTNPVWTPLFLTAGALIMESGGPISHGAIVAREYGLPAIAGLANATSLLKDGDVVVVDGQKGTVRVVNNE